MYRYNWGLSPIVLLHGADEEEEEAQKDEEEVDDLAPQVLLVEEQGTAQE